MQAKTVESIQIPENFICPLTLLPMRQPVRASDGYCYELDAINKHLETHSTSPMTRQALDKKLIPADILQEKINLFFDNNPKLKNERYISVEMWSKLAEHIKHGRIKKFKKMIRAEPRLLHYSPEDAVRLGFTFYPKNLTASSLTAFHLAGEFYTHELCELVKDLLGPEKYALLLRPVRWEPRMLDEELEFAMLQQDNVAATKRLHGLGATGKQDPNVGIIVRFLMGQMDKTPESDRFEALAILVKLNNFQMLQEVLTQNPHLAKLSSSTRGNLAHIAWENNRHDMLHFLITKCKLDYNQTDSLGNNVFHLLFRSNFNDRTAACANTILEQVPSLIERPNKRGFTPLHLAVSFSNPQAVNYLLDNYANVTATTADWDSPLHLAAGNDRADLVEVLVRRGASLMQQNKQGLPAISVATTPEVLARLKQAGAQLNIEHFIAAYNSSKELLQADSYIWLLQNGLNFSKDPYHGYILLLKGIQMENVEFVQALIAMGAALTPNQAVRDYVHSQAEHDPCGNIGLGSSCSARGWDKSALEFAFNHLSDKSIGIIKALIDHGVKIDFDVDSRSNDTLQRRTICEYLQKAHEKQKEQAALRVAEPIVSAQKEISKPVETRLCGQEELKLIVTPLQRYVKIGFKTFWHHHNQDAHKLIAKVLTTNDLDLIGSHIYNAMSTLQTSRPNANHANSGYYRALREASTTYKSIVDVSPHSNLKPIS